MHDIFISYSSVDKVHAQHLAKSLEKEGFTVWWDRKIPAGKSFDEIIENAIDNAKCIVILWSDNSVKSEWARVEADEGRKRKILVPVLIEEVEIPLAFRNIQSANLSHWNKDTNDPVFRQLVTDIGSVVGGTVTKPLRASFKPKDKKKPDSTKPSLSKNYTKPILIGVAGVLILIAVILNIKPNVPDPNEMYNTYITDAQYYYTIGDYKNAKSQFQNALSVEPNSTDAKNGLQDCENRLNGGGALDPNTKDTQNEFQSLLNTANQYKIQENYGAAIEAYTIAANYAQDNNVLDGITAVEIAACKSKLAGDTKTKQFQDLVNRGAELWTGAMVDDAIPFFQEAIYIASENDITSSFDLYEFEGEYSFLVRNSTLFNGVYQFSEWVSENNMVLKSSVDPNIYYGSSLVMGSENTGNQWLYNVLIFNWNGSQRCYVELIGDSFGSIDYYSYAYGFIQNGVFQMQFKDIEGNYGEYLFQK